jgi:hypothetical protein
LFYYFPNNYTWSSAVMLSLLNFGVPLQGSGPFQQNDLLDRPAGIFGGRTTVHIGGDAASWLQLPIVGGNG